METYWTHDRIVAAIRAWAWGHGGEPPRAIDWAKGAPHHPANTTVLAYFGSWNRGIEAAGFKGRPSQAPGPWNRWNKDMVAEAFLDFLLANKRWPTTIDCGRYTTQPNPRVPSLPSWQVVYRIFGSFVEGKRYAGWDGTFQCGSCGGDRNERTVGCSACTERARTRRYRASLKSAACSPVQDTRDAVTATPGGGILSTREAATAARRAA